MKNRNVKLNVLKMTVLCMYIDLHIYNVMTDKAGFCDICR